MIMSFPDFGIYPEELRKANRLIISIAKNYNLTENDLDDADDIAKDIINIRLREEKYPLNKLTNTIYEIIKFYTTDKVKKVYEVLCIVEKHNEEVDLKVAIFAEGEKGCHRLTFYLNDYEARKKGRAAEKKALTAIEEYIAYMRTDTKAKAC